MGASKTCSQWGKGGVFQGLGTRSLSPPPRSRVGGDPPQATEGRQQAGACTPPGPHVQLMDTPHTPEESDPAKGWIGKEIGA